MPAGGQLRAARSLKLDDQVGWYPAAVPHLDALRLGPLTNFGGSWPATRILPADSGAPPAGRAADLPASRDVLRRGFPQLFRMSGAEVNLVVRAIQTKADSSFCFTAIDVIDEQGLYLLGHACSVLRGEDGDKYSPASAISLRDHAQANTQVFMTRCRRYRQPIPLPRDANRCASPARDR